MLAITSRPAQMGPTINARTEKHGDEDVPAMDIGISEIMLTIDELDVLLGTKGEAKRLFNMRDKPPAPLFTMFGPQHLTETFEDVQVYLLLGMDDYKLDLFNCKLKGIVLTPQTGGMTELACKVQFSGELDGDDLARLIEAKNKQIAIELVGGKIAEKKARKQRELDLDHGAGEITEEFVDADDTLKEFTHPDQLFDKPRGRTRRRKVDEEAAH